MIAEKIASFVCNLKYSEISENTLKRARYQILSVLSGCIAGYSSGVSEPVRRFILSKNHLTENSHLKSTIFPPGEQLRLDDAVFYNTASSVALDFDDYLFMGHTGHSSVLTALALTEALGLSTEEMLTAIVAGNEIGGRMGLACLLGPLNGQMWSFIHSAISSAIAGRLIGLSVDETTHAIALSLSHPPFPLKAPFLTTDAKILTVSIPCLMGLNSAFLAKEGLRGCIDIFENQYGFLNKFSYGYRDFAFSGLKNVFLTNTIAFKPYPSCAYLTTVVDSIMKILKEIAKENRKFNADDVQTINVRCNFITALLAGTSEKLLKNNNNFNPVSVNFSLKLTSALAILKGKLTSEEFRKENLNSRQKEILKLAGKIKYKSDIGYTIKTIESVEKSFRDFSILSLYSGSELAGIFKRFRDDNPLSGDDIGSLFSAITRGALKMPRLIKNIMHGIFSAPSEATFDGFRGHEIPLLFPVEVTIRLNNGSKWANYAEIPNGGERNENDFEVVQNKVRQEFTLAGMKEKAEGAINIVENIEKKDIRELINVCVK